MWPFPLHPMPVPANAPPVRFNPDNFEEALLDAMNATLAFGKTGAVIAAAIRSLK